MKRRATGAHGRDDADDIEVVRGFNRLYTRQLGLLEHGLLGSQCTLTEARVLYELANRAECTATDIARELGIDPGYLSRLIDKFARRLYIKRWRSPTDARQTRLQLTDKGRAAFDPLDRAARQQIAAMIDPMPPEQRTQLLGAMRSIQRLLQPASAQPPQEACCIRPLGIGDIGWIIHRQGVLYSREYGWDATYEALVAEILARFVQNFDPRAECGWVAERDNTIVGSVFVVRVSDSLAKLRLLYVEPAARGSGLGMRLVRECVSFARAKGYERLTLWTNDVLESARRIYAAAGFQLTKQEAHHSFGKHLNGQTWELVL